MYRNAIAAIIGLACLVGATTSACSQPRAIPRDTVGAGASGVRLEQMDPHFADDPDILAAMAALDDGSGQQAARLMSAWLIDNPGHQLTEMVQFIVAYATYETGAYDAAIPLLQECVETPLWADYCLYFAARSAYEIGDTDNAALWGSMVSPDSAFADRAWYFRAAAYTLAEDYDAAIPAYEDLIATFPSSGYRDESESALARAHLAMGNIEDAANIYHRVALLNPGSSLESNALAALEPLLVQLPSDVAAHMTQRSTNESVERANVLFDRHRSDEVIELLQGVIGDMNAGSDAYCEASYLIGKSYTKLRQHSDSVSWYENVVAHCDDEELVVRAYYNLGRGLWNADRDADALVVLEELWTDYAANSYADDGMLMAARIYRSNDDEEDFVSLLETQIESFPDGDMLKDAVWLLMAQHYMAGDYREARDFADRVESRTGENDIYSFGRIRYFRARSLEQLSQSTEAESAYTEIVRSYPMSFYSLLALNRLQALNATAASALRDELREPADEQTEGFIEIRPAEVGQHASFIRGVEFLRMGLYGFAQREFRLLEAAFPNNDDVGWVLSVLLHRAGAYHLSHHVPGAIEALNQTYPAGDNIERWQVAYPLAFIEPVETFAAERGIDPYMVLAIMREESGFVEGIESWANARGLMQLMHGTANDMAALTGRGSVSESQLFNGEINIELGTMFMRTLSDSFSDHPCLIIGGYNGGRGNINSWLDERGDLAIDLWVEEIPYEQTRNYVKRVTMTYWIYRWLYADGEPFVEIPFDLTSVRD